MDLTKLSFHDLLELRSTLHKLMHEGSGWIEKYTSWDEFDVKLRKIDREMKIRFDSI
jgi:hypothetical protein